MPSKIWPAQNVVRKKYSRRMSTTSSIKYPMYLLSYQNLMDLYDDENTKMAAHQLLREGMHLVRWEEIKDNENAFIVFVSHEWLGWKHADPNGEQLHVLCKVLKRLANGDVNKVEIPAYQRMLMGTKNYVVTRKEWKKLLPNAYFWIDWMSMPQPSAEIKPKKDDGEELSQGDVLESSANPFVLRKSSNAVFRQAPLEDADLKLLELESKNAIASIPAYVERSDLVLVLAPGCRHCDRKNEVTGKLVRTCYRTWRTRGWCVLEYLATFLSRDKQFPMMVVTSAKCTPYFAPLIDVLKLTIAKSKFTCCQRNHNFTDSRGQVVGCDKFVCGQILAPLIETKIAFLYATGKYSQARLLDGASRHILGGLGQDSEFVLMSKVMKDVSAFEATENYDDVVVRQFKKTLRWRDRVDGHYLDAEKLPLLIVAVLRCDVIAIRAIIRSIHTLTLQERNDCLHCTLPDEAGKVVHAPTGVNALDMAMAFGTPDVVTELLKGGMDPSRRNASFGSGIAINTLFGEVGLLRAWLDKLPDWDMTRRYFKPNSTLIHLAVYWGIKKMPMVDFLLKNYGDKIDVCCVNDTGGSILANACESEDSDPEVVQRIIDELRARAKDENSFLEMVNKQRRATRKWRMIYALGKFLHATHISRRGMLWQIGQSDGNTPLHAAVNNGDAEIVEILLEAGADPTIRNNNGHTPTDFARLRGPFPSLVRLLNLHTSSGNSVGMTS